MNKYMVYFLDSRGHREGVEVIEATSRKEAIKTYKQYFNVNEDCKAIPRIEVEKNAKV